MVRATPVNFGIKTDGVIALDINAIGHLLDATGPIDTEFYGKLTGKNVAQKLIIDAYEDASDDAAVEARHDVNDQLMGVMLSRMTEGGGLITKARALGEAIPGRHLQMYFRDKALQSVVVDKDMAGTIPVRDTGNLSAVYTQNGNGNKLDVFQRADGPRDRPAARRRLGHRHAHRRAARTRPRRTPRRFPDRLRGYDTRYATNLVINLMPPGAKVARAAGGGARPPPWPTVSTRPGRTYAQAAIMLPPDGSARAHLEVPSEERSRRARRHDVLPRLRRAAVDAAGADAATSRSSHRTGGRPTRPPAGPPTPKGVTASVPMDHTQVLKVLLRR